MIFSTAVSAAFCSVFTAKNSLISISSPRRVPLPLVLLPLILYKAVKERKGEGKGEGEGKEEGKGKGKGKERGEELES